MPGEISLSKPFLKETKTSYPELGPAQVHTLGTHSLVDSLKENWMGGGGGVQRHLGPVCLVVPNGFVEPSMDLTAVFAKTQSSR